MFLRADLRASSSRGKAGSALGGVAPLSILPVVVTAAQVFFEPKIEANEKVAASHFLNLQFGDAGSAVAPCNRDRGPGIAANDGLERKLDREIEVG